MQDYNKSVSEKSEDTIPSCRENEHRSELYSLLIRIIDYFWGRPKYNTLAVDSYLTIESPSEALYKDRGSKFLAFAIPVKSENDIRQNLLSLRELHPKAVHHCYAWRLGADENRFRSNDDGEPSGSAGKPILNTLYSLALSDVLVVVVRYFGGTLLGVPGLINAYKTAADDALRQASTLTRYVTNIHRLTFPYERMNEVMRIVKDMNLTILTQTFEMTCALTLELRRSLETTFLERCEKIRDLEVINVSQ